MSEAAKKYRKKKFFSPLVLLLGALFLTAVFWPIKSDKTGIRLDAENKNLVQRGKVLYSQHCASCHGQNLEGQPNWKQKGEDGHRLAPPHDDSGHTWHHSDSFLIKAVRDGMKESDGSPSNMPAFGHLLEDEEIIAVLSYIKSHWSPEHQAVQEERTRADR